MLNLIKGKYILKLKSTLFLLALSICAQNSAMAEEQLFNKFYLGAGASAGFTQFDAVHDSGELPGNPEDAEFINKSWDFSGGGYAQVGKDWQLNNSWVAGLVFDYNHLNNKVTGRESDDPEEDFIRFKGENMMTLRGRLGYLVTDRTMLYGTAGVASYKAKFSAYDNMDDVSSNTGSKKIRSTDLIFGGGITWFTPSSDNFSVNLEALYYTGGDKKRFSEDSVSIDTDLGDFAQVRKAATLKLGVNYSF